MDEPSKAILVPANRFEVMECQAALDANYIGAQDTPPVGKGALDVLAQHVLGMACAEPFDMLKLYDEITSASPYADLDLGNLRADRRFRRDRRLCAANLRALRPIRKTKEGAGASPIRRSPSSIA
jgi:ATP-dependent Lhr-like helicase